jgi:hypothetical protein
MLVESKAKVPSFKTTSAAPLASQQQHKLVKNK